MTIERQRVSLILPDTSPLISLAYASLTTKNDPNYLDLLLTAGLPIYVTDQVKWEATKLKATGNFVATYIDGWFSSRPDIHEAPTRIGAMRAAAEASGALNKKMLEDLGEELVLQAIRSGGIPAGPYLFLFGEDRLAGPSFFGAYPVHVVSLYGFLVGLERGKIICSADEVLHAIRPGGRPGSKADVIDRPTRKVASRRGGIQAASRGAARKSARGTD